MWTSRCTAQKSHLLGTLPFVSVQWCPREGTCCCSCPLLVGVCILWRTIYKPGLCLFFLCQLIVGYTTLWDRLTLRETRQCSRSRDHRNLCHQHIWLILLVRPGPNQIYVTYIHLVVICFLCPTWWLGGSDNTQFMMEAQITWWQCGPLSSIHFFLGSIPAAYGSSQARGWIIIRDAAVDLWHNHSRYEPHLWVTSQITATLDHLTHWERPGIETSSSWIIVRFLTHWATMGTPIILFLNTVPGLEVFLKRRVVIFGRWKDVSPKYPKPLLPFKYRNSSRLQIAYLSIIFFVFLPFLGLLPWHMDIPGLGVESEL